MRLARNNILHDTVSNFKRILPISELYSDLSHLKEQEENEDMPLYEYQCKKCGKKFEALVSLRNSDDPVKCPHCDSEKTDKLLSTFSASVGSSTKGACCNTGST